MPLPRLTAWYGEPEAAYRYSGLQNEPRPWTPALRALRDRVCMALGVPFNGVLLNRYRSGADGMSWHADDEPELGAVIASLSLGATRRFILRHTATGTTVEQALSHGSLLVMSGATQRHWRHRVPKEPKVHAERINLTFRVVAE